MAPYYPNLVLLAGMKLSLEETAIRNKVLYTLVMEIISEQNAEEVPTLEVRNTLPTCPPLIFMKVTEAKKEADNMLTNKTAKRRVAPFTKLLEIASKNDTETLFEMAPKKISATINALTAAAAGVKIESWDPRKLAAIEEKLSLSYRHLASVLQVRRNQ